MRAKHSWQSWLAAAATLFLLLAAPAQAQQIRGNPSITVYESPT